MSLLPKSKGTVYLVQRIGWQYNDEYYYREDGDTGIPTVVFESKEQADKECERLNKIERKQWGVRDNWFELNDCYPDESPTDIDKVPFYEVVEVHVGEGPNG